MDFLKLATERYSVRQFADKPIEKEVLDKILEAGRIAPTGCNYQPQRILVINSDETLEKLKECTRCHFNTPCALLICYNKDECWTRPYDGNQSGIVDASIITTHMMLQAWELGVGSTWVMHFNPFKIREEFAIPESIEPVALLVMGYPAPDAVPNERHTVYRPAEETVFYNKL